MATLPTEKLELITAARVLGVQVKGEQVRLEVPVGKSAVIIPNMFTSFLSPEPKVNPNYQKVKEASEKWICE